MEYTLYGDKKAIIWNLIGSDIYGGTIWSGDYYSLSFRVRMPTDTYVLKKSIASSTQGGVPLFV